MGRYSIVGSTVIDPAGLQRPDSLDKMSTEMAISFFWSDVSWHMSWLDLALELALIAITELDWAALGDISG